MKGNGKKFKTYRNKKLKDKKFSVMYEEATMHLKVARLVGELRQKCGLTQAELAEEAGVSQPMIARIETGDPNRVPTLPTISKVFRALGYEIDLHIRRIT